jgi:Cu/Ag efflux protein CusF
MEQIMNKIKCLTLASLMIIATVCAAEDGEMERPSMYASQTAMVTAVVEAIDVETRVVTVRKTDGESLTFTASEDARNLAQVSVGDILMAEYQETISIEVMANEGYEPEAAKMDAAARTEEGEMPGFAAMDATVITATVEEINIEANTFKLKGPDGTINEYVARNPENLKRSQVGDLVVITITEAIAIIVEEAAAE